MPGKRQDQSEFTIERGQEKVGGADRTSARNASSVPHGEHRAGQAEFDLGGTAGRQAESGIPERLRQKYYVAEADAGDEAKVYADPRGEYLAFKVSTDRMATRLEDAGVVRDMVSVAQHRGWKEIDLRGSVEFRRTAWLEASARGLSVRGYEPDPVDRAALSFRTKAEDRPTRAPSQFRRPEPEASETISVAGVSTRRPIEVTVLPPERSTEKRRQREDDRAPFQGPLRSDRASSGGAGTTGERPAHRPALTIDVVALRSDTPRRSSRSTGQRRADVFRSGEDRQSVGDDVITAARSQLAAIERALNKAIRDPKLRHSVLAHAKERIAKQLEKGGAFKHAELRERSVQRQSSPENKLEPKRHHRSNAAEAYRER